MFIQQQEYISILIESGEKMSLEDFFKNIRQKFYPDQDISFMKYFLELTEVQGEFVVHHEKLIEYGVVKSKKSSGIKDRLNELELVENIDYSLRSNIVRQWNGARGTKHAKVYMLTLEAFKTCLLRAQRRRAQKVDPVIYSRYYLLLEKTYKLYTDYEKRLLNKKIEQQAHQLEQKNHQIETQARQLEEQRRYTLDLQEGLLSIIPELEKTQIVYIATSHNYAKSHLLKVGETEKHITHEELKETTVSIQTYKKSKITGK